MGTTPFASTISVMKHIQQSESESFLEDERKHQLINVVQKYKRQSRILMIVAVLLLCAVAAVAISLLVANISKIDRA